MGSDVVSGQFVLVSASYLVPANIHYYYFMPRVAQCQHYFATTYAHYERQIRKIIFSFLLNFLTYFSRVLLFHTGYTILSLVFSFMCSLVANFVFSFTLTTGSCFCHVCTSYIVMFSFETMWLVNSEQPEDS